MKWLILSWALSFAYVPDCIDTVREQGYIPATVVLPEKTFAVDVRLQADVLKHLRIFGGTEAYMTPAWSAYFAPLRQDYTFGIALYAGPLELGITHECDHFVFSGSWDGPLYGKTETQLYVRLSGRTSF